MLLAPVQGSTIKRVNTDLVPEIITDFFCERASGLNGAQGNNEDISDNELTLMLLCMAPNTGIPGTPGPRDGCCGKSRL